MLWLLVACSDNAIHPVVETDTGGPPVDAGTTVPPTASVDPWEEPLPSCPDPALGSLDVDVAKACQPPVGGTLELALEWSLQDDDGVLMGEIASLGQPTVGSLTDDDGDGDVDADDTPDIVVQTWMNTVVAVSGDGTTEHWRQDGLGGMMYNLHPAIGDLDGDGLPEVIAQGLQDGAYALYALSGQTGQIVWKSTLNGTEFNPNHASASIADLDGDGIAEVTIGNAILDGVTGSVLAVGGDGTGVLTCEVGYTMDRTVQSVPFDVDLDGQMELVTGNTLYDSAGNTLWYSGLVDGSVAVANFDDDAEAEIVSVYNMGLCSNSEGAVVRLQEHDGTQLWEIAGPWGSSGGPPTVADFDGDGGPEIAMVYSTYAGAYSEAWISVLDSDGSSLWQTEITDELGDAALSALDVDRDGAHEIVYRTDSALVLLDGLTGSVVAELDGLVGNAGSYGAPVIADVDGDLQAEIVVMGSEAGVGVLQVLGGAQGDWPEVARSWNQHGYSITNIDESLGVPTYTEPNWPEHNSFRAADTEPRRTIDAEPLVEVCEVECDQGRVEVVVRIANHGWEPMGAGVPWRLENGAGDVLYTSAVAAEVPSGSTTEGQVIELAAAQVETGLRVIVDDDPYLKVLHECDVANNVIELVDPLCE